MEKITYNFSEQEGYIKPLHGVNNAPYAVLNEELSTEFMKGAGIPFSRLHDAMGPYGGSHYVDVPNIFPDFDADAADPSNYDFTLTDYYIGSIVKAGTEIFYRLGITIDWAKKKYRTFPPKDYLQWAKICEGIMRHYNEGWADGFHYNIRYWEIWNEPENPPMWSGSKEEFFELYRVASKYLKNRFPQCKIGGYGSCGFYAVTREGMNDFYKGFVTYFHDFLKMVTAEKLPLDFFSWHIYTNDPCEVLKHGAYVRKTLDEYGLQDTETTLNEWNYGDEGTSHYEKRTMKGASFVSSVLCGLQHEGHTDSAMYYCVSLGGLYNGMHDHVTGKYLKPYYALAAFHDLYRLGNNVKAEYRSNGKFCSAAATDGNHAVVLLSNHSDEEISAELVLDGIIKKKEILAEYYLLDEMHDMDKIRTEIFRGDVAIPVVSLGARTVMKIIISIN